VSGPCAYALHSLASARRNPATWLPIPRVETVMLCPTENCRKTRAANFRAGDAFAVEKRVSPRYPVFPSGEGVGVAGKSIDQEFPIFRRENSRDARAPVRNHGASVDYCG
jgi:hypothetical protein